MPFPARVHSFTAETELPLPRAEVFAFFADAANLQRITPPELGFEIRSAMPVELREGTLIEYRLRLLGIPFGWTTRIAAWDPPARFVDEQLRGPYRQWVHEHAFTAVGERTRMRDTVRWSLPMQPFGELAYPLVKFQIGRIFAYRETAIRELLRERMG
ncbi:MAG: SRPBCC family protein [Thermoanaerobaculia bacterium]